MIGQCSDRERERERERQRPRLGHQVNKGESRVCRFIAGQLIKAYTRADPLPNSVRFTRPTVPVRFTVYRSTLLQATQPRKDFHSNKRKCLSLELKAEIINQVDMI